MTEHQRPSDGHRGTRTSAFGVGKRENHDSTLFYERFTAPIVDQTGTPAQAQRGIDELYCGDARDTGVIDKISDDTVALVVTSPPYFAGKEYEAALGHGHIPADYLDYLEMLHDVFAGCVAKLEPGGRIAVNVANLGRRPYRSLSHDVIDIFDDLGLLLRGEIIWQKSAGLTGSTAWGSFQSAANPVLRDMTERVVVASKGRFDRALSRKERAAQGLPHEVSIWREDFMDATTDVWEIDAESATRVGHPAPFPVELPQRLIDLYTFRGDLVLDPFIGSGTTAVAALRTQRHYVGFDTDADYVAAAQRRVSEETERIGRIEKNDPRLRSRLVSIPTGGFEDDESADDFFQSRAVRQGQKARELAVEVLTRSGFKVVNPDKPLKHRSGVAVSIEVTDQSRKKWYIFVSGAFTTNRPGLRRTDTLWKALGKAATLHAADRPSRKNARILFLTTDLPNPGTEGAKALKQSRGDLYFDAIEMLSVEGQLRLRDYATGDHVRPIGDLLLPEREQ